MTDATASTSGISYRDAGVDIDAGNALVERIKPAVKSTLRSGVLGGIGGFGGLFELPGGYRNPVLVSGTDGVGTKLKVATMLEQHNSIGTCRVICFSWGENVSSRLFGLFVHANREEHVWQSSL